MNNLFDGAVLVDHFLMVGVALLRAATFDLLAHHDVDSKILLNVEGQFKKSWMGNQELHVAFVLFHTPIVTRVFWLALSGGLPPAHFFQIL